MIANDDLPKLTTAQLVAARYKTVRDIARDPDLFIWVGPHSWLRQAEWGVERIALIDQLLGPPAAGKTAQKKAKPWA